MLTKNDYNNRLFQILNNDSFSSKFIAGIAGDRIQSQEEKILYDKLLQEAGGDFYVKLLFFITHESFEKKQAFELWEEIILHKKKLSSILDRNVEITVATLDYLTNIKKEIKNPKLIGEAFIGKIAEISSIDPLTKLFNRQHLTQIFKIEFTRYKRYSIPFSILLIDIDKFKNINDAYGHQEGDAVLIDISEILHSSLRDLDTCSRYGGEEFLAVLPHTEEDESIETAERIRTAVQEHFSNKMNITVSVGAATCPKSAVAIDDLIKKADEALYLSKNKGRNKVSFI